MDIITSTTNETVKETVKLQQKKYRDNLFIMEGQKVIDGAIESDIKIQKIFINQKNEKLIQKYKNCNLILTNEAVLKKISTTESAPDILAVGEQKKYSIENIQGLNKILLLENIKDAGNLGTIIRSALAFNFDAIILFGDTVDLYNPKTLRATVGNLWKIPIVNIKEFSTLQQSFSNYQRIATLPLSTNYLKNFTFKYPILLMFGSEADGLSDELKNFATTDLKIEMNKKVESLNLSVSAAVVMYEISSKQMI